MKQEQQNHSSSTPLFRKQQTARRARLFGLLLLLAATLAGCSASKIAVQGSMLLMEGAREAMNREPDLDFAHQAMAANIKMLEGLVYTDPGNSELRLVLAEGLQGYAFAFVEADQPERAMEFYQRCYEQASAASRLRNFTETVDRGSLKDLESLLTSAGPGDVPAMFWSGYCIAKWVDLNRDEVQSFARLSRAVALMERVIALDDAFYHGGPHMFFGAYYGGRSQVLGGDFDRSERHFSRARELTGGKLLIVDVLQAEYLERQRLDRDAFHDKLTAVLEASDDLYPEMTFLNQVSKARARRLLAKEAEWF